MPDERLTRLQTEDAEPRAQGEMLHRARQGEMLRVLSGAFVGGPDCCGRFWVRCFRGWCRGVR